MTSFQAVLIFAVIVGVALLSASFIAEFLRIKGHSEKRIAWLEERIASWWLILFIFILALAIGKYGVVVLFALCAFSALREFLSLTQITRGDHWPLLAIMFVVLPLQFIFVALDWVGMTFVFIPVYAFLLLPIISVFRASDSKHFLNRMSQYQWAMMLCIYCMSHLPALMFLHIDGYHMHNIVLLVYLIFIVEIARVFSHVISTQVRARKLASHIQRTQNVIGFFGAALVSAAIGAALHFVTPFGPIAAFALSFCVALMGLGGIFVMTAIKRDQGVRSFDVAIAGHGGFLDGLGALLYAAPIYFHLIRYFWAS